MRSFLKEYFSFSSSEMRVISVLGIMVMLLIMVRFSLNKLNPAPQSVPEEMITEVDNFILSFENTQMKEKISEDDPVELHPFAFDPNNVSKEDLLSMGISERVAENIILYRSAGGSFRKAPDLKKIYGLGLKEYEILLPYILIREERIQKQFLKHQAGELTAENPTRNNQDYENERYSNADTDKNNFESLSKTNAQFPLISNENIIELNSAGQEELMRIKGIGKVFSSRIVKYRELLGGFNSIQQLSEVYGITDSMVNSWENIILVNNGHIRTLSVNHAEYIELLRHPYLQKKDVESILKFREWKKRSFEPFDLKKEAILSDSVFNRIYPYLVK